MSKRTRKTAVFFVCASLFLGAGVFVWNDFRAFKNTPILLPKEGVRYVLKKGTGFAKFSLDFYEKGFISSLNYFRWLAKINGSANKLRAGEYFFSEGITPGKLLNKLEQGDVVQHGFTLVEGWDLKAVLHALKTDTNIKATLEGDAEEIADILGISEASPEGWLLPETYFFTLGMTDVSILRRAFHAMKTYLEKVWPLRAEGLKLETPYEALILASLIEKETGQARERKTISGVFHRRLKKNMRLETDPTVIYGMGDAYQGNIKKKHLRMDTPYNTYTRHGLPPTPIAMPSAAAIEAALHPEEGDALYFVAKGDGSHVFSSNFKDHLAAVRQYQLKKRHAK